MAAINDSSYLTMSELARRLDLPESTMRYYCKRFAKFLPYKGEGRRRRYAPETEKTLLFIANAMHQNKNATAVELMLQSGQYGYQINAQTGRLDVLAPSTGVAPHSSAPQAALFSPDSGQMLLNIMERQAEALGKIAESLGALALNLGHNSAGVTASDSSISLGALADAQNDAAAADSSAGATSSAELREEINSLKQQMFTAEKMHQEDLEQLRKWLGHMGEAVAKLSS